MTQVSQPSSSVMKLCALCNFWGGPRETNIQNTLVKYDNASLGKCVGGSGYPRAKQEVGAQTTCYKYSKWTVLK